MTHLCQNPLGKPGANPPLASEPVRVRAVRPDRDHLEIGFPRVAGYRRKPPHEGLLAVDFNRHHALELTPELVGSTVVRNSGIVGEFVDVDVKDLGSIRQNQVVYELAWHLARTRWRSVGEPASLRLFGRLMRVAREWMDNSLVCRGATYPAQLLHEDLMERACDRIELAILKKHASAEVVQAVLSPHDPAGSTGNVDFRTSNTLRHKTDSRLCHLNWAVLDSAWEVEFCRVVEAHPKVLAYVKNHGLGLAVPYRLGMERRVYAPDFIVVVDDGKGALDPLNLVVEINGFRGEDAKDRKATMDSLWVPGVNRLGSHGRWAFAEFRNAFELRARFDRILAIHLDHIIRFHSGDPAAIAGEGLIQAGGTDPNAFVPPRKRPWDDFERRRTP